MFIVLEGIDGSGKSTQARLLAEALRAKGRYVTELRFPERRNITGKAISAWLKNDIEPPIDIRSDIPIGPLAFQALMVVNRIEELPALRKALGDGDVVLDRYWPSGFAYGLMDGLDRKWLLSINEGLPKPDLFVMLDIDVETSEQRRESRATVETYEAKPREFRAGLISKYRELWNWHVGESAWATVNARGIQMETTARLVQLVDERRSSLASTRIRELL